jgi:alkylhydroperoxidase family enzyme
LLEDRALVDAVLEDYTTAPIGAREKALFAFIEKVNRQSNQIGEGDIQAVVGAGWTEEAVYDAITVCALFNFYNTWIDATGVRDMPAAAYDMLGQRLATQGYAPSAERGPAG